MADLAAALATQITNIESKTGQSMEALCEQARGCGRLKHGEIRDWVKQTFGLGHGDANTVAHLARAVPQAGASEADPLDTIYSGAKASLRPLHDQVIARITPFGPFEVAPKKAYVSLRRKKQFAMLGPATKDLLELGLNIKGLTPDARLKIVPPGGMCQVKVRLGQACEIDAQLLGWLRAAFDSAG